MDWRTLAEIVFGLFSMSGAGGTFIAWRKFNHAAKLERQKTESEIAATQALTQSEIATAKALTQAKIDEAKAETELKIEQARVDLINDLMTEKDKANLAVVNANKKIQELLDQLELARARIIMLEMILIDNKIPLPA